MPVEELMKGELKMKAVVKLLMLLTILAICMPAYGQDGSAILIYAKTMKCFEAYEIGDDIWELFSDTYKGFLVLDVFFLNGEIDGINSAVQIDYWKDDEGKWYSTNFYDLDYEKIEFDGEVWWVLEELNIETGPDGVEVMILNGQARNINAGLGRDAKLEAPPMLQGSIIEFFPAEPYKLVCCESLKILSCWTRRANDPDKGDRDIKYAIYNIVVQWLERRGFEEELL
jgi:hypothetical protein